MEQNSRLPVVIVTLSLLAIGSLGAAIYFWRQNVNLRIRLQANTAGAPVSGSAVVRRVREGDQLPEFAARDTEGQKIQVGARGRSSVLFVYDPDCERCEASFPSWIKVNEKLAQLGATAQVVALSVADSYATVQHARRLRLPFAVVPFPSIELQKTYGASEVPLTVVLDGQGLVQAVWDKPLDAGAVGDVIGMVCQECLKRALAVRSVVSKEGKAE